MQSTEAEDDVKGARSPPFLHLRFTPGTHVTHCLPLFAHEQSEHDPVALHLQHLVKLPSRLSSAADLTGSWTDARGADISSLPAGIENTAFRKVAPEVAPAQQTSELVPPANTLVPSLFGSSLLSLSLSNRDSEATFRRRTTGFEKGDGPFKRRVTVSDGLGVTAEDGPIPEPAGQELEIPERQPFEQRS